MFGASAFGWPYFGQAYAGTTTVTSNVSDSDAGTLTQSVLTAGPVTTKSDSESASLGSSWSLAATVTASDTPSVASAVTSIAFTDADTGTSADAGGLTDATPPPAPQADTFTLASTAAISAGVADTDTQTLLEAAAAVVASTIAVSDTDTGLLAELGSNSSGGTGSALIGVVIAFGNNALDANPVWTRLDDPVGVS